MKLRLMITAATVGLFAMQANAAPANQNAVAPANPAAMKQNATAHHASNQGHAAFKTEQEKVSYAIGYDMGENLKAQNIQIQPNVLAQGIQDGMTGGKGKMSQKDMEDTLAAFQKKIIAQQQQQQTAIGDKNAKEGQAFLAENAKKPGVESLPSGLQYKVVEAGKGTKPTENDYVTVNYEGKTLNGQVFDSTYERGQPITFKLSQVIQGWQEGLKLMAPGATYMLYIPANLAYGERGLGGPIGPNETLVFKVHLISVSNKNPDAKQQTES